MAMSSPLSLIMVAIGGVAVGFVAAQALSSPSAVTETATQVVLENLTFGERTAGEITTSSELNGKDGSRFLRYAVNLEEGALVEFSLRGALQGVVALYDEQLTLLGSASTLRQPIKEDGEYLVVVSGIDEHSYGPFILHSRAIELSDSNTLTVGTPLDSWLDGTPRELTLSIEEAGMYQLEMLSDDFDAYLELAGPNGYYREDDDSAGNLNARIADFLAPGDYQLTARSAFGEGSGLFTLTAESKTLPGNGELRNSGSVTPGDTLSGWYSGRPLDYELIIDEAGMYQIEMRSSDVDAYLELAGPGGYFREDDDSAGNLDARIADFMAPGVYQLTARTAFGSGNGLFSLSVTSRDLPRGVELRNDGALTPNEVLNGWYSGERLTYQFTLEESALVTVAMRSRDFDAFIELHGEGVAYSDDDGGVGTDALLTKPLLPGTYTVIARGFSDRGSGMFELEMSAEPTSLRPTL